MLKRKEWYETEKLLLVSEIPSLVERLTKGWSVNELRKQMKRALVQDEMKTYRFRQCGKRNTSVSHRRHWMSKHYPRCLSFCFLVIAVNEVPDEEVQQCQSWASFRGIIIPATHFATHNHRAHSTFVVGCKCCVAVAAEVDLWWNFHCCLYKFVVIFLLSPAGKTKACVKLAMNTQLELSNNSGWLSQLIDIS